MNYEFVFFFPKGVNIVKKITSLILALVLVLSLNATVFAADTQSQDVTAKYEKTETEDPIYNVDIKWVDLTFTYSETTEKTWNPATHTYDEETTGSWDKTEAELVVANHSNVAVEVTMTLKPVEGTGVEVSLTGGSGTLAAGVEGDVEGAASVTGKLTVSGTPNDTVTAEGIKVGEVTVTIE